LVTKRLVPHNDIRLLFKTAIDRLCPSADPAIEDLRWQIVHGDLTSRHAAPDDIAEQTQSSRQWANYAFLDMRVNGFIENDIHAFVWQTCDPAHLAEIMDTMSALEAAALIRLRRQNISHLHAQLHYRIDELLRLAEGQSPLAVTLSYQKLALTIIAAVGSADLLAEYVDIGRTWACYAWAAHMPREIIPRAVDAAELAIRHLSDKNSLDAVRAFTAPKFLPCVQTLDAITLS